MPATHTIIVGSGVAAAAVARRLLNKNSSAHVTIFEAGDHFEIRNYRKWTDFVMTGKSPTKSYEDLLTDVEIETDCRFSVTGGRMMARGGSTNHWGGWCPRMKPEDFLLGNERKGSINWPISYADIAHYYTEAEGLFHVCGDSNNSSVPRYEEPFPHKPIDFTALDQLLIPTFKALKYNYESLPIARDPAICKTTGTCRYCPMGARYTGAADLDQLLYEYGSRIQVRVNSPVVSVRMKDRKTTTGIAYLDPATKARKEQDADRVIVAAGTIESAKLLLASTGKSFWQNGVGNDTDHVGCHIVTHPLLRAFGRIQSNPKHLEQEIDFPTLMCRHFDTQEHQSTGKMFFVRDGKYIQRKIADALLANKLADRKTPAEINDLIASDTRIELRAFVEAFAGEGNRVSLSNDVTALGLPKAKIFYHEAPETQNARVVHQKNLDSFLRSAGLKDAPALDAGGPRADHAASTCRMSNSPADGVVDKDLRVHETDNLFVCSNAVFPNIGAVNPTLTLTALALRLGDLLATA